MSCRIWLHIARSWVVHAANEVWSPEMELWRQAVAPFHEQPPVAAPYAVEPPAPKPCWPTSSAITLKLFS
jgi:hypothetical protein